MALFTIRRRQALATPYEFDDDLYTRSRYNSALDLLVTLILTVFAIGVLYVAGTYFKLNYANSHVYTQPTFNLTNGSSTNGEQANYGPSLK